MSPSPTYKGRLDKAQLDGLRVLLSFLKGRGDGWKAPTMGRIEKEVPRRLLEDFLFEGGYLHNGVPGRDEALRALYRLVYEEMQNSAFRDALKSVIKTVYPHGLDVEAMRRPGWDLAEWAGIRPSPEDVHALFERLDGCYLLYRYASFPSVRRLVRSALQFVMPEIDGERRLMFNICYPKVGESGHPAEIRIRGDVVPTKDHLCLVGYDKLSQTPYLLALARPDQDTVVKSLQGMVLRYTNEKVLTASRLYGVATRLSWAKACGRATFIDADEFTAGGKNRALAKVLFRMIDNTVDNNLSYVLAEFSRGPHDLNP